MDCLNDLSVIARDLKALANENGICESVITDLKLSQVAIERYDAAIANTKMKSLRTRMKERLMIQPVLKEAKTMLIGLVPYPSNLESPHIASYALCDDYHEIILSRLNVIVKYATDKLADIKCYPFVDAMPVAEKAFAEKAGIGFQGLNTLITNRSYGSKIFLCGILFTIELPPDNVQVDNGHDACSKCFKCETECPTGALSGGVLDAAKCLAYSTIEHRGQFTDEQKQKIGKNIFGCGICVNVCPFNSGKPTVEDSKWAIRHELVNADINKLEEMATGNFERYFAKTAIERLGRENLLRNIQATKE
jgi:epoxyqueuosine reductase